MKAKKLVDAWQYLRVVLSAKQRFMTAKLIFSSLGKAGGAAKFLVAGKSSSPVLFTVVAGCVSFVGYTQWQKFPLWVRTAPSVSGDEQEAENIFDAIDVDRSGAVDPAELQAALRRAGHQFSWLEIQILMLSADENGDGLLSRDEWMKIWRESQSRRNGRQGNETQ